jgi:site-specific DNA-methyltransferase (adenine-specific)
MMKQFTNQDPTWETPQWLFDLISEEFGFTLDVCSNHENAKCEKHFTVDDNGLAQSWSEHTCWMNPPYGRDVRKWCKKAYEESIGGALVVGLVPARVDTGWWFDYCINAAEIRFIRGRLRFGDSNSNAPFPSAVVIWDNSVRDSQREIIWWDPRRTP